MRTTIAARARHRIYELLERDAPGDVTAKIIHRLLIALILCNVIGSVLDTVPAINAAYDPYFDRFESISLIVFATEYIIRLWVAPENPMFSHRSALSARLGWMVSAAGLIDLLAIAPFIVSQLFDVDLRVIVLLRLLRFFKIARYSPGFHSLAVAVRAEKHSLAACLVILVSVVLTSAGLMYVIEHDAQPEKFGSIPDAMWWAAATVTTVGYGDVVPITPLGRMVGVVTMITGLVMLALPAGIVASAFATTIARQNFVVTAGMIANMPLFAGMDAAAIFEILPSLATRHFERGAQIVHHGARAGTLYMVVDGEVEIEQGKHRHRLGPREAFGGVMGPQRDLSARATTRVKLMMIEEQDLLQLCRSLPQFVDRIAALEPDRRRQLRAHEVLNKLTQPLT
jgi:voltage-gated potassium channel